jgi:hypothetical protein
MNKELFLFFIIFNHSFRLKSFIDFLYDRDFAICWKSMTFFMHFIINKFSEFEKSRRWRSSKCRFKTLRIEKIDEIDSMLSVLIFAVERIEKSETSTVDWLSWDEEMKMITKFDFRICLFVESIIDSMIDRFVDEISTIDDSSRFSLIQMTNETR